MSLTADAADGKTGYRSSADANSISGKGENVCRPHISHLQWRVSIATAATVVAMPHNQ